MPCRIGRSPTTVEVGGLHLGIVPPSTVAREETIAARARAFKEKEAEKSRVARASARGPKDKEWGYQGACYVCAKVGHKAWECEAKHVGANAVHEEEVGDEEEV